MNITRRSHVRTDYLELLDIELARNLTSAVYQCIDELRDVILKRYLHMDFGVALLHKHFDVSDDEYLVELGERDGWEQVTMPLPSCELPIDQLTPTISRVSLMASGETEIVDLEFGLVDNVTSTTFNTQDSAFFIEIADVLNRHSMQNRLGLANRGAFLGSAEMVVVEHSSTDPRVLFCELQPRAEVDRSQIVTTQWFWQLDIENSGTPKSMKQQCTRTCWSVQEQQCVYAPASPLAPTGHTQQYVYRHQANHGINWVPD
jgi:hypothetical protein